MYTEKLEKIGLNKSQSDIYSLLLHTGKLKGSEITAQVSISRQLVYKVLDELMEMQLVKKNDTKGSAATFEITHPNHLEKLLHKKEEAIKKAQQELDLVINNLTSDYNLISGQPGVQVFEGEEGVKKVLEDSLKTQGEILTYADVEPIITHMSKLNDDYVATRTKRGIQKRALVLNTPFARKYMQNHSSRKITDTRFLSNDNTPPFSAFVEIYDDKVSYVTFEDGKLIGIIIQNTSIAEMNKYLFEFA